jgi:TolB-like protein
VRLEARRLRTDLDSYYVDAGSQDPVRISVPKGGYVPHFAWQNQHARVPAPPSEPDPQDLVPPSMDATATPSPDTETASKRRRGRVAVAVALLALGGLAAFSALVVGLRGSESDVAEAGVPAIVVLPFEAYGDSEDIGLIASGVTEELIANLMLFQDFRLYATTTSFRLDAGVDPEILKRDLGVSFVVTGVMQLQNGQVQLHARLVDTESGQVHWSGSYSEALTPGNLFGVQRDLAVAISTELGQPYGAVNEAVNRRMIRGSRPSMPSYTCVLRAYDYRRSFDDALFAPAFACLKQAVVRDPEYADAWAMLGWLHLDAVRQGIAPEAEHPAEMSAAFDAASHAVELEPRNPRTLAALSVVMFHRGDYAASENLQREVLALNPYDPDTLAQLGWRLAVRGNREGLEYLHQAIARSANPLDWYYHMIAVYAYLDGDYARALSAAEKSSTSGSSLGLSFAAMSYAKLGDMEAAHDALTAMAETWPLMGRDPAAAYRAYGTEELIVEALVEGLRAAGWTPPAEASPQKSLSPRNPRLTDKTETAS